MGDPFVMSIVLEVVKALLGMFVAVVIPALTIFLTIYTKRMNAKAQRKTLQAEIDRQSAVAFTTRSFEIMDYDSKVDAIVESILDYARRNDLEVHKTEVKMMVESSFSSLKMLESAGLKLYKLKLSKEKKDGYVIEK
jgi:cell division protein FtsL